ncbi:MAG: hypothetical protein GC168_18690 [Candidatus Hydrogenedens sp.]|nr:hypothetical protein [Candidatus Hydrogenedens sp.]
MTNGGETAGRAFDLNAVYQNQSVTIVPAEPRDVLILRAQSDAQSQRLRDWQEFIQFAALLLGLLAVAGLCVWKGMFDPAASPEAQRLAQVVLTAIVSGSFSFLAGRAVGRAGSSR